MNRKKSFDSTALRFAYQKSDQKNGIYGPGSYDAKDSFCVNLFNSNFQTSRRFSLRNGRQMNQTVFIDEIN